MMPENKESPIIVDSLSKYFEVIEAWEASIGGIPLRSSKKILFRGEPRKYENPCHSSLARYIHETSFSTDTRLQELSALNMWVSESERAERRTYPDHKWEQLMWARHHNLKTRLTDWSFNPLTSLWFACSDIGRPQSSNPEDGFVYICREDVYSLSRIKSPDPFLYEAESYEIKLLNDTFMEKDSIFVLPPNNLNNRIANQTGVFHASTHVTKSALNFCSFHSQVIIPAQHKGKLLSDLARCNVNRQTLGLDTPDNLAELQNQRFFS